MSIDMKTKTFVPVPIMSCLREIENFLSSKGGSVSWKSLNNRQEEFLKTKLSDLEMDEIGNDLESIVSLDFQEVNDWIKSRGFEIKLTDPNNPGAIAVASILKVFLKWRKKGRASNLSYNSKPYPAVVIDDDVTVYKDENIHPHPIACIETLNGKVYMSILNHMPVGDEGLREKVLSLQTLCLYNENVIPCDGVVFPMIDYDQEVDISWLVGLSAGLSYFIGEALQQTKFRMNEYGALAESVAAMGCYRGMTFNKDFKVNIDEPFVLWVEKEGVGTPLFMGIFCEDSWKRPEDFQGGDEK